MYKASERGTGAARRAIATALTIALASAPLTFAATPAVAATSDELRAQLEEARATLDELYFAAEQTAGELGQATWELEQTRKRITELEGLIERNKVELTDKQAVLSEQVASSYKEGNVSLIDVIFESTSFDDFVSRITYANRVNEFYVNTIAEVRDLRAQLDSEEQELATREESQVEQVSQQEEKLAASQAAQAAQANYINGLSDELRSAIEEERRQAEEEARRAAEEAAARRQAEEAARRAAEEQAQQSRQSEPSQETSSPEPERESTSERESESQETSRTPEPEETIETYTEPVESVTYNPVYYTAPVASTATSDQRQTAIDAALSQIGVPYAWGGETPGVGFDCSGLTHYAWASAGVQIPGYSFAQYQWLLSNGRFVTDRSALQPGDLVLYSYDGGVTTYHVALYLGGGQVVHANGYRWGVMVSDIDFDEGYIGGGSPI